MAAGSSPTCFLGTHLCDTTASSCAADGGLVTGTRHTGPGSGREGQQAAGRVPMTKEPPEIDLAVPNIVAVRSPHEFALFNPSRGGQKVGRLALQPWNFGITIDLRKVPHTQQSGHASHWQLVDTRIRR